MRVFLILLWFFASAAWAALPVDVQKALRAANIPAAHLSVWVQQVDAPRPRLQNGAQTPVQPASVMKLSTTYAALDLLGPAHTWKTRLLAGGEVHNGVLNGPLWLQGGGDPRLALEDVWLMLRQLRLQGIERIRGGLAIDDSLFSEPQAGSAAFDGQGYRAYNVEPDAALLNFNVFRLSVLPQGDRVNVRLDPGWPGLTIDNRLQPGQGECGEWDDGIHVEVDGQGMRWVVRLMGQYPLSCGPKALPLSLLPHRLYDYALISTLWSELGGRLEGGVSEGRVPDTATVLAEHESEPLAVLVRDINKFSNNVMARQVFLTLGAELAGPTGNRETASAVLQDWLNKKGLDPAVWVFDNGCGLSRQEQTSAEALGKLLLSAYHSPVFSEFESSLPIVAVDGTMKKRLTDGEIAGHAHIKTGYIMGVRSVAGYVFDRNGKRWVVVGILNDPRAINGKGVLDTLLEWVYGGVSRH